MTDVPYINIPVITRAENVNFFGTLGTIISGTEDISNLPDGSQVLISIFDENIGRTINDTAIQVESDGSWQFSKAPPAVATGHKIYAIASYNVSGGLGPTSQPSDPAIVTGVK